MQANDKYYVVGWWHCGQAADLLGLLEFNPEMGEEPDRCRAFWYAVLVKDDIRIY